jgi:hypothetical protein
MDQQVSSRPQCPTCKAVEEVTCYKYRGHNPIEYVCWSCGAKFKPGANMLVVFWKPSLQAERLTIPELGLLEQR